MRIDAKCGETVYSLVQRAIQKSSYHCAEVMAVHNGTVVRIYPQSFEYDILEKFRMQRVIDSYKGCGELNG